MTGPLSKEVLSSLLLSRRRRYRLPAQLPMRRAFPTDAVSASCDRGILTVRVSGAYAGTEPRRITVTSAAPAVESPTEPQSDSSEG